MRVLEEWVELGVNRRLDKIRAAEADWRGHQERRLRAILKHNADTEFGREHGFASIERPEDYRKAVPIHTAADYADAWRRVYEGQSDVLCADPVLAFALSSGTTGEPKRIPLTKGAIRSLKRAISYTAASSMARTRNFGLLRGYALQLTAQSELERSPGDVPVGYITGLLGADRPYPFHQIGIPPADVLNIPDWEEKLGVIVERYGEHDVRTIFGVPAYLIALLRRLEEAEGRPVRETWPELRLVVTSGSPIAPYRERFARLCGDDAEQVEMYLATEAAVGFQPDTDPALMPMVEDVYFEFVPEAEWGGDDPARLGLGEIERDVPYVLLVTNAAGLYAYVLGDVVRFTALDPPRLVVEGRTDRALNLATEKLSGKQAAAALEAAGIRCDAFLVCPAAGEVPAHEWVLEVAGALPEDAGERIDAALLRINPSYEGVRGGDAVLAPPRVTAVPPGTFEAAVRRLPGQGKILRVHSDRAMRDAIVARA